MQVRGLPRQIIRNGAAAARLLAAKTPNIEAERRRAAVTRWRVAMANGLTAEQAAQAVGVPRSTLYRWEKDATPKSRRPRRVRQKGWTPTLRQAVERLRLDFPMWGRAKIGPLVRAEGFAASDATVGRILASLVARGVVEAVPALRRRPYARRWTAKRRFAKRLPRDLSVGEPGGLVQLDTVFINLTPTKAIKHFTAYDPIAKWTVGKAFNRATAKAAAAFLDKVIADMPFPVKAIQVDGGSEFMAEFEAACQAKGVALYVLPPRRPQMNGAVERCNGAWRYEFYET
jgi:putative transposase